jgi:hypothetical protein
MKWPVATALMCCHAASSAAIKYCCDTCCNDVLPPTLMSCHEVQLPSYHRVPVLVPGNVLAVGTAVQRRSGGGWGAQQHVPCHQALACSTAAEHRCRLLPLLQKVGPSAPGALLLPVLPEQQREQRRSRERWPRLLPQSVGSRNGATQCFHRKHGGQHLTSGPPGHDHCCADQTCYMVLLLCAAANS